MSQRITIQNAGRFALAGDAILTIVRPQRTIINGDDETIDQEKRFTYRIERASTKKDKDPDPRRPWFVKVLNGPDNLKDYKYLGTVFPAKYDDSIVYYHGKKSKVEADAPSSRGIAWFIKNLSSLVKLRKDLEQGKDKAEERIAKLESKLNKLLYYHEGRCGRCARTLTVPESIINGLGPICAKKDGGGLDLLDFLARL